VIASGKRDGLGLRIRTDFAALFVTEFKLGLIGAIHARAQQTHALKEKRMVAVAAKLCTARARVEKWALNFDDVTVLQQYRRGQRALEQALADASAQTFHEGRQQVKQRRHQLQPLQTLQIGRVKTTLREFKSLTAMLGLKNDLAVLTRQLARHRSIAQVTIPLASKR
jgi:CHAD domain-containing protein